ncbi:KTSC domain-containing protein [Amycolatopsis jiangsuensis]|uniref:KTSC domain-containing protein n=1 Tax=Amycolatopsis jiangsuensis TaxID=1181879 RepID=UPI0028A83C92|nr:KTSC domain-containing protein [Amycolatopsis jiangsuensis]
MIRDVGYDPARRVCEVGFHSGVVYQYFLVPARVHREFLAAESHGRYLNLEIKPRFGFRRVD